MSIGLTRGQIRSEVRTYLANIDLNQAGWTEAELESYMDEGAFYIQQLASSFWDYAVTPAVASQADYSLPDNCYQLIRTTFDRQFLPQTTEYELDRDTSSAWRGDPTGRPARFYLKQFNQVSLYQVPRTSGNSYSASQETGEALNFTLPDNVTLDTSFSFSSNFGVVVQMTNTSGSSIIRFSPDPQNRFMNPDLGIVIGFADDTQNLGFMFLAQTDTMTDDTQSPQLDQPLHPAMVYYTLMRCFAREGEFQDMELANAWYQAFLDWMDAALQAGAKEFPTMVKSAEPYGIGNILNGRLQAVGPPSQMIIIGTP